MIEDDENDRDDDDVRVIPTRDEQGGVGTELETMDFVVRCVDESVSTKSKFT